VGHAGLAGRTPEPSADAVSARTSVDKYRWRLARRWVARSTFHTTWPALSTIPLPVMLMVGGAVGTIGAGLAAWCSHGFHSN
jgi:hypothetical protein